MAFLSLSPFLPSLWLGHWQGQLACWPGRQNPRNTLVYSPVLHGLRLPLVKSEQSCQQPQDPPFPLDSEYQAPRHQKTK